MLKRTLVIIPFVVVIMVACSSSPTDIAEPAVGESLESETSLEDDGSEVEESSTESGEADLDLDGAVIPLPDGFPESFPLPEGALVVADFSMPQEENDFKVYFEVPGTFEETMGFFETAIPDAGWEIQGTQDYSSADTQSFEIRVSGYGFGGRVLILCCAGGTGLEISLEPSL